VMPLLLCRMHCGWMPAGLSLLQQCFKCSPSLCETDAYFA
jgi:hypothetical protein